MEWVLGGVIGLIIGGMGGFFSQKSKLQEKEYELQKVERLLREANQDCESRLQATVTSLYKDYKEEKETALEELRQSFQTDIGKYQARIDELERQLSA
ncbi:MAG: hypothetical protein DSM107014_05050 [Gomphosphaeria aponina SAG 52.96 = DSM 107014]|uniref:Uncharacterized protein n=1 Tax=Gomphosphaeria aponina SAG 52.96 = DSM 107014 TaxID=1521640 RepID=A0A941JSS0_9CHRO|nr:hypothetical protein [Gomphosphaeria aponina SAG 52.96 = DSM 107014]